MRTITLFLGLSLLFSACCTIPQPKPTTVKENLFVLLTEPDSTARGITVTNPVGTVHLTKPFETTSVKDPVTAPKAPYIIPAAEVERIFGPALRAQPLPPARIILYFEPGRTVLTAESERNIAQILEAIKIRESNSISIVGHTDRVGTREANFRLGLDRAARVRDLLIQRGVSASAVETFSHGEDNPLVPTPDEVAEPRNRRVEVTVR